MWPLLPLLLLVVVVVGSTCKPHLLLQRLRLAEVLLCPRQLRQQSLAGPAGCSIALQQLQQPLLLLLLLQECGMLGGVSVGLPQVQQQLLLQLLGRASQQLVLVAVVVARNAACLCHGGRLR
jgi:hypothetical protein